jgi:hypothetical protein
MFSFEGIVSEVLVLNQEELKAFHRRGAETQSFYLLVAPAAQLT